MMARNGARVQRSGRQRRLISGGLVFLLMNVMLTLLVPNRAAADHQPTPPQQRVYDLSFTTTGQNVWGPGAGDAPTSNKYDFFNETWNENSTERDIQTFAGMKFGGSIGGYTNGEIGMGAKFKGFTGGGLSINYPVEVSMTMPTIDSFRAGQTVSLGSSMIVQPSAGITVAPSSGDIELIGTFDFHAGANAEVCFISCSGNIPIVPAINIPRQDGKILAVSELMSVCGFVQDNAPTIPGVKLVQPGPGCTITEQMANAANLPITGTVGLPNVQMNVTLQGDGKTLKATGTHENFVNLDVDVTGIMNSITGGGLGIALPGLIPGVSASATAFQSTANVRISQAHEVVFSPTVEGTIVLPASAPAVLYRVKNPAGIVVSTGTGRTIVFDVGNKVEIDVPPTLNPGDVINVTPTFAIKQGANFTNNVHTSFATDLNSEALMVEVGTPSYVVIPSVEIFPEVCWPLAGCSDAVYSPELKAPAISVNLGPVWEYLQPLFAETDSSLFDGNEPAWQMGGFTDTTVNSYVLNPQYTPVVTVAGPTVRNEAQAGTYNFTFSDADLDALTYTLEWGDGAVETGTGNPAGTAFAKSHTYIDNGTFLVKLTVNDGHRAGVATQSVLVNNVAPVLSGMTLTSSLNEYGVATISGIITDPGIVDNFALEIDWGGPAGQKEQLDVLALPAKTNSFTRTHHYKDDNTTGTPSDLYTVTVKVTDKDNASDTKSVNTTVINVTPTVFAGSDRVIDEGSFTRLGVELFGKNLLQGGDAEDGTADWANLTGGFTTKPYGPAGSGSLGYITMYSGGNGTGYSKTFPTSNVSCLTSHNFDGTSINMNDRVNSILVPSGMTLTIFQHCDYGGWQETYTQGTHTFPYPDASSMKIVAAPLGITYITDDTPGYYNEAIGLMLNNTQPQFQTTTDFDLGTNVAQPNLAPVAGVLGNWLSNTTSLNGYWSGVQDIPFLWPEHHETAIVYPIDVPEGGSHLSGDFGADNGVFVWVDGVYKFGAVQPGGLSAEEYKLVDLGFLPAGRHYIQVLREDHGGLAGLLIRVRGTVNRGGTLAVDSPGPSDRETSYYGAVGTGSATQTINVASIAPQIDSAGTAFQMAGWLGGAIEDTDSAKLTASFLNASGGVVGTAVMGPVTAAERGNTTKLMERSKTGNVPAGTRTIVLTLEATLAAGATNQAGADNLSFYLLPAPGSKATAGFTDPGLLDTHTSNMTWGDGSPSEVPVMTGVAGNRTLDQQHGYKDNGAFTVNVNVGDDDTGTHSHSFTTTVRNVPATVQPIEQVYILGRSESKLLAAFTDPGALDTHTASIDWGDGTAASAGAVSETLGMQAGVLTKGTVTGTHTYNLPGPYPRVVLANVTVTDKDGGVRTIPVRITVTNLEVPSANLTTSAQSITESGSVNFGGSFGAIVFPAGASTFTPNYDYVLTYGDGSPAAIGVATPGAAINHSHAYAQNGTYIATLKIRAYEGLRLATYTTVSKVITVNNAAPVVNAGTSKTINEGGSISLNPATFTDLGQQDKHLSVINWGDGSNLESGNLNQGTGSGSVAAGHTFQRDGIFTVTVQVTDSDGAIGTGSFQVTVQKVAPVVNPIANQTIGEGQTASLNASFVDPGLEDGYTATIVWGDGLTETVPVNMGNKSLSGSHVYTNNGSYPVSVCVVDGDGSGCKTLTITVLNSPPVVAGVANQSVTEGQTVFVATSFTDSGAKDTHVATVNWGDGTSSPGLINPASRTVTASHKYLQDGVFTVTVTVTDGDHGSVGSGQGSTSFAATVANVAPIVVAGSNQSLIEGATLTLNPAIFSDPGTLDTHTATINWGDGSSSAGVVGESEGTVSGSHVYVNNGSFTVTVCAFDGKDQDCDGFTASIANAAPTVEAGADQTATEGAMVTVAAAVSDPGTADVVTTTVNWGDGTSTTGATGTHAYADNGRYTVSVCAADNDGGSSCDTLVVTVSNVAPTANAGNDQAANEGDTVAVSGSFTDPGTVDTHTATINWGDGTSTDGLSGSHVYADNGSYTVGVCVKDSDGAIGCDSLVVTVANVAPVIDAGVDRTTDQGRRVGLPATFTDPGTIDAHTATINWGDGNTTAGEVMAGYVIGSHSYNNVGDYTVKVCITDKDGASDCDEMTVTVLNAAPKVYVGPGASVTEGETFATAGPFTATVYETDFSGATVDDVWSPATITSAPSGERFLGRFLNDPISLNLSNLPQHSQLTISFDLHAIGSWDGNGNGCCGPDIFEFQAEGQSLLRTTFSNTGPTNRQSYPGAFLSGDNPAQTGAVTINQLGYGSDSFYRLTFTIPHTDTAAAFRFLANNLTDETWGIDNVVVTVPVAGPIYADPGSESRTATVDYGDGSPVAPLALNADRTFALQHVYADNGTYTVTVAVTDEFDAVGTDSLTVQVSNVTSTLDAGPDQIADEGSVVSLAPSTFNDLGTLDTHVATVEWGDNTGVQNANVTESPFGPPGANAGANGTIDANHVYADNGTYLVTVTLTDDDGATITDTFTVTVNNVTPTLDAGPDQIADEGSVVSLAPSTFNDMGTLDTHVATIEWGDHTGVQTATVTESPFGPPGATSGANGTVDANHVYADNGTYLVTVTLTDDDHAVITSTFTVTVNNVTPTLAAGPDQIVNEGDLVNLAPSTFNDMGTLDTHTATVNWGDGTITETGAVAESPFGPPGATSGANGTISTNHVYADNGTYLVTVVLTDDDGAVITSTFSVTVNNVDPTVNAGPTQIVNEGDLVFLAPSTFNDMGTLDTHTATVNWGDGTATEDGAVAESPFGPPGATSGANGTVAANHVYADNGLYTVTVTVTDDDGATTTSTTTVTVLNVVPTVQIDTVKDEFGNVVGTDIAFALQRLNLDLDASFNDKGTLDTHLAQTNWGDGITTDAKVTQSPFGPPGIVAGQDGTIVDNHDYALANLYTITLTLTDDDLGQTPTTKPIVVKDSAGAVEAVLPMLQAAAAQPGLNPEAVTELNKAIRDLAGNGGALSNIQARNWPAFFQKVENSLKSIIKAEGYAGGSLNLTRAKQILILSAKSSLVVLIDKAQLVTTAPGHPEKIASALNSLATGTMLMKAGDFLGAIDQFRTGLQTIEGILESRTDEGGGNGPSPSTDSGTEPTPSGGGKKGK